MAISNGTKFEFCNTHIFYLSKRLQFLAYKSDILTIYLKQLLKTQSINKIFYQLICNNYKWVWKKTVFYSASQSRNEEICNHCSGKQHLSKSSSSNKNTTRPPKNLMAIEHKSKALVKIIWSSFCITSLPISHKFFFILDNKFFLGAD